MYYILKLQTATIKQNREKEKLKVTHDKQMDELSKDVDNVSMHFLFSFLTFSAYDHNLYR